MKTLKGLAIGLTMVAAGCASDGSSLVPGQSTTADVEATMGAPKERIQDGADTVLFYPRQPYGRQTFAARIGADGKLKAVEQRMSQPYISRIRTGMTMPEVRRELGPPATATRYARLDRDIWEYRAREVEWMRLSVQFGPDGLVKEVLYMEDPDRFQGGAEIGGEPRR